MPIKADTIKSLAKHGRNFCILPWTHFHAWPDGKVLPCCISDSNAPVARINKDQSILQMMNSEDYKKLRVEMLNDRPVAACRRCYDLEVLGTWTMRQSHNKRRGDEYGDRISQTTNDDGSLTEFKMRYMDIRFSNLCNFKCRSCGPECSSKRAEELLNHVGPEEYQKHFNAGKIVVNNNEDHQFMEKLKPYLNDVVEVYFAGGEIIIQPEHYECLDYWIENGLTNQVELTYTTNFSSLKYKQNVDLIAYWKKFPKLKIWASLDAYGKGAEIIRSGADWTRIVKNIKTLQEQVPHAEFEITPTISIWNVFSFPDFIAHLIDQGFISKTSNPRFNMLTHPWYANIMILPTTVKEKLIKLYEEHRLRYAVDTEIHRGFNMILYNLSVGKENKGGIKEFMQFNEGLDKIRRENLVEVMPELKEVFEWART